MRRRVDLAQPVDRDERVDLRRRDRRVPEQLLDDAHVGPAVEQVGGERVPQHVGADPAGSPARPAACCRTVHAVWREIRPPRVLTKTAGPRGASAGRPRTSQASRARARERADGHQPLLGPLAAEQDAAVGEVEVVDVEPDGLGDARARPVEQLEQRAAAEQRRVVGSGPVLRRAGRGQQRLHLAHRQRLRQAAGGRRRSDRPGRIVGDLALPMGEAVQTTHRHERARRRAGRERTMLVVPGPQRRKEVRDRVLARPRRGCVLRGGSGTRSSGAGPVGRRTGCSRRARVRRSSGRDSDGTGRRGRRPPEEAGRPHQPCAPRRSALAARRIRCV